MSFEWLNEESQKFLYKGYLSEGETPKERVWDICKAAEDINGIEGFADKLFKYCSYGWVSFSSPIWANFGKQRGMPISCFSSYVGDSVGEILEAQSEVGMMSKIGGGTSGYFGDIRARGSQISDTGKTSGSVHFMELFEKMTDVVSQGGVRRGYFTPYLPIDHGDIDEFLDVATEGSSIQTMTTGVTVKDYWMDQMLNGDTDKRKTWGKVLKRRNEIGFPYVFFYDNVQRNRPDVYKEKEVKIKNSNLCSEILLPVKEDESFVCDLCSANVTYYDDWKDTDLIETLIYFLDAVMSEFIQKLEGYRDSLSKDDNLIFKNMERAYNFAKRHRALGLGVLGWHSLLQSKMIPFGSKRAMDLSNEVFSFIQEKSYKGSRELASMFGEPEILEGYGRRNTTLNAIAPTTSSAFILGQVSQSIEPLMSNYYVKDLAKIKAEIKNPYLKCLLEEKGNNTKDVWESIMKNDGSVQHLTDILTDHEREVFLTFSEIDSYDVINQAAFRQKYLDQTQSLNLMIPTSFSAKDINKLMIHAWEMGICTLYYQHSVNAAQQFAKDNCQSCEA